VVRIAFIIYDGMTALDFIGVYDPVTRLNTMGFLPDLEWEICARSGTVRMAPGLVSPRPGGRASFTHSI
jgi:cyclohexyl-isocyanide hydratase